MIMADSEEPQLTTLAERIAALNKQKSFDPLVSSVANAAQKPGKRPPPPAPPVRPANAQRRQTVPAVINGSSHENETSHGTSATSKAPPPLPPRGTSTSSTSRVTIPTMGKTAPPPLPGRRPMPPTLPTQTPPALPRRTSAQSTYLSVRRDSTSSEVSQHSAVSTRSLSGTASSSASYMSVGSATRKMAPATFDPASLPALPPSKRGLEAKVKEAAAKEAAAKEARGNEIRARQAANTQDPRNAISASPCLAPALRPVLPPRTSNSSSSSTPTTTTTTTDTGDVKPVARRLPSSTIRGFGSAQAVKPSILPQQGVQRVPTISASDAARGDVPPPVPLSSRPSIADVEAVSTRTVAQQSSSANPDACWVCRDWSRPDAVAAQFPRQSLPRHDIVGHLARGLCDPFPSYSDKARAIFTWCHHNIAYDTVSFFNNGVRHHSVEDTITSGLAVCQGYAEVYMAVARRAGLECIVVAGHGKGFGHTALRKGERPPPAKPDGHAWNAVRVDGGVWKLVDACWGAGHICSASNTYKKEFSPREFTLSNELFGRRHFPRDPNHQFRADGRAESWDEYYRGGVDGEPYQWFGTGNHEGLSEESVEPKNKDISVHKEQVVRFQFSKTCEHWTPEKAGLGKPALFLLSIHGRDGRADELIPMDTNGYWHWVDVHAADLGSPGQAVEIIKLDSMDGGDARGVTAGEFMSKRGRVGMSWSYIAKWNLVS